MGDWIKVLADFGSAGAFLLCIIIFGKFLREQLDAAREERQDWREAIENHLSHAEQAQQQLSQSIQMQTQAFQQMTTVMMTRGCLARREDVMRRLDVDGDNSP